MGLKRGLALSIIFLLAGGGCTATRSFPVAARGGDMVVLPVGWNQDLSRQSVTVTITPSLGASITYGPNDPNIRAIVNLYPDPVSKLVVGTETDQELGVGANLYGASINDQITAADKDWWNTVVYLRLPSNVPQGDAQIDITGPQGLVTQHPIVVEILPAAGTTTGGDPFNSAELEQQLASLERADHYLIDFVGSAVPHAIQVEFSHTLGVGKPWVANPRGDIKNVAWSDDGANLRVLLTPTHGQTPAQLAHFRFYIAGGISDLRVTQVKAYDVNGNPIPDIVAEVR